MTNDKDIDIIKQQILNLDDKFFDLNAWLLATDNYLKAIWGNETHKSKQLYAVSNTMSASMFGYNETDVIKFKSQWKSLLNSYIIELEKLEKPAQPTKTAMNNINLTVNQNQEQTQKQTQEQIVIIDVIIDALKDELTGKQLKELNTIIKEPDNPEKSKKVIDKILSFGSNVAAGILGNILTNPQIIGLI